MNSIRELHEEAMDLAEQADRAKEQGDEEKAQALYRHALKLETQAADETPMGTEPTRSILYRSAATLALNCGFEQEVEQLVAKGLQNSTPDSIVDELLDIIFHARQFFAQKSLKKVIGVEWLNEEESLLYFNLYSRRLSQEDFYSADKYIVVMLDSVGHPVDIIIDFSKQIYFSPHFFRDWTSVYFLHHHNLRSVIVVGGFAGEVFSLIIPLLKKTSFVYSHALTLNAALNIIKQKV